MVCLRNICVNTLHKGDSIFTNNNDDDDDDDNNNNNINFEKVEAICITFPEEGVFLDESK
jgi:hypothetical protein